MRGKSQQPEAKIDHLGVLLAFDHRGELVGGYPCALNDAEFEIVREALARLIRPGFYGLLRRVFGVSRK